MTISIQSMAEGRVHVLSGELELPAQLVAGGIVGDCLDHGLGWLFNMLEQFA